MPNPTPLSAEQAYTTIYQRVYAPVFFHKLAEDYGIRPANETEAVEMLHQAAQLRAAHDAQVQKQANDQGSLLARSRDNLNKVLGQSFDPQHENLIKRAADELSADPELVRAALSLQLQPAA